MNQHAIDVIEKIGADKIADHFEIHKNAVTHWRVKGIPAARRTDFDELANQGEWPRPAVDAYTRGRRGRPKKER